MRVRCVLIVLPFIVLGCAFLITSVNGGKQVLVKIEVPEVVKHQHHTNVVYVHKHHNDHGDHEEYHPKYHDGGSHSHSDHHSHSYGGHYSHSHGEPHGHRHSHSFGHQHHFSFSHGDGDYNHGSHGTGHEGHTKGASVSPYHNVEKYGGSGQGTQKHKPVNYGNNHYEEEYSKEKDKGIHFTLQGNFNYPNTKTKHYSHATFTPIFPFDNNNNLKKSNKTIKRLKINTVQNLQPEVENYNEFSKTVTNDGYEIKEPTFNINTDQHNTHYNKKPGFSGYHVVSGYSYSDDLKDDKENLGSYAEDYTNPSSVAKYTSDIQHDSINLHDTSYNPEHGNDLDEDIKAFKDFEEV